MEKWKKKALELLVGIAFTAKKDPAVLEPYPQKTVIMKREPKRLTRPLLKKSFTLSPKRLQSMMKALEEERRANIHSITVVKDGRLLLDASHPGYSSDMPHLSHSMSKTLTGIAVGLLWDRGRIDLDTPVLSFFPKITPQDKRCYSMTVHHLLSMTAGSPFAEIGVATEDSWTEAFFGSQLSFAPGEKFSYNSMNSYILGLIVRRICGESLTELLSRELLQPLGIESFFWEKSPEGFEKGGFGVYMSCEAWARVGVMLLQRGVYGGRRILSPEWIKLATYAHGVPPLETGAFNYGYHIWCGRENDEILINGMLGQNVWICPRNNIVVSINSGNNELFQESPALTIIRAYLGSDISHDPQAEYRTITSLKEKERSFFTGRHWIKPKERLKGLSYRLGLRTATPFDESFTPILGDYAFPENNCQGILPLFLAVMQSSFLGGIEGLKIERVGEGLFFTFTEGGRAFRFEAGIYSFRTTELDIDGERYLLSAMAQAIEDEDRRPIYKLELIFPELPNSKIIKLNMDTGRLVMRISETPNQKIAENYLGKIASSPKLAFIVGMIEKKLGDGYLEKKLTSVFNPTLYGISKERMGYERILADESRITRENRENATRLLTAFMNRFILEDTEDDERTEKREGGFFKRAIMGLFSRKKQSEDAVVGAESAEAEPTLPEPTYEEADGYNSEEKLLPEASEGTDSAEAAPVSETAVRNENREASAIFSEETKPESESKKAVEDSIAMADSTPDSVSESLSDSDILAELESAAANGIRLDAIGIRLAEGGADASSSSDVPDGNTDGQSGGEGDSSDL